MDDLERYSDTDPTHERSVPNGPLSEAVVRAVSDYRNTDPTDLPPLTRAIDPDALDSLFEDTLGGHSRRGGVVIFEYSGCTVVANSEKVVVGDGD